MHYPQPRVIYCIIFFLLSMCLILAARPQFMFNEDGSTKPFGVGQGETILSVGSVSVAIAVISMYTFSMIDMLHAPFTITTEKHMSPM